MNGFRGGRKPKIDWDVVAYIERSADNNCALARKFDLNESTVRRIRNGEHAISPQLGPRPMAVSAA